MWSILYIHNFKMVYNNNFGKRGQVPMGRAQVLAQAIQRFGRRDRGKGLGPPPLMVNCPGGPIGQEGACSGVGGGRSGRLQEGRRGWIPSSTPSTPQSPPSPHENHFTGMGAHPRRRYPEDLLNFPNPQLHPPRIQEIFPPTRYAPSYIESPSNYDELYPPGQTFLLLVWPPQSCPKVLPHPLFPL